jgi:hypothetical protein
MASQAVDLFFRRSFPTLSPAPTGLYANTRFAGSGQSEVPRQE